MNLGNLAVNRALGALRAYEIFPYNTEIVRLAVLPMVAVELSDMICQYLRQTRDTAFLYHFRESVLSEYRKGVDKHDFTVTQNLEITNPEISNFKEMSLTWTTLFGQRGMKQEMKISLLARTRNETDLEFRTVQDRLAALTKFLHEYDKQQESK